MLQLAWRLTAAWAFWWYFAPRSEPTRSIATSRSAYAVEEKVSQREPARISRLNTIFSTLGIIIATASAIFTYYQVELSRDQVAVTQDMLQQAITVEDLRFVGRISTRIDLPTQQIEIANYSDFPLTEAVLWTLGISEVDGNDTRLDTIRAPLSGLGACRTMKLPAASITDAVTRQLPGAVVEETYLTFKAPSGAWYTVSENISYERVEGTSNNALEAASRTYSDQILGDTAQEGVNQWKTVVTDLPVGPNAPVSGFAIGGAVLVAVMK